VAEVVVAAAVVAAAGGADDVAEVAEVADVADVAVDEAAGAGAGLATVLQAPSPKSPMRPHTSKAVEGAIRFIAVHFVDVVPGLLPGRQG